MFTNIISAITNITTWEGQRLTFTPSPEGGIFEGRLDPNMEGPGGHTYGAVSVYGVVVPGYICHHSGVFIALDGPNAHLVPRRPEPNRIGLGSAGFPDRQPVGV